MQTDKSSTISSSEEGIATAGHNISLWVGTAKPSESDTPRHKLTADQETDVVIVGAGLSGLSIAYCLTQAGKRVMVVEDGLIGSGETGRTTAHISNALDDLYTEIKKYHGPDGARISAESHTAAIEFIAGIVKKENIDCDFKRVDGYLFLHPTDKPDTLKDEFEATNQAGIPTVLLNNVPGITSEKGPCLHFPNQAQFHPMKYLQGLASCITRDGGRIFTETHADEISKEGIKAGGYTIKASQIVVATNSPVNNMFALHTKQYPYRSYVIAALIPKNSVSPALWWDTGDQESKWLSKPYTYVRVQAFDEHDDIIICGGQDHKTGQADTEDIPEEDRYSALRVWLNEHFPNAGEIIYKWSGQVMEPLDLVGYIGRNPGDENIYIVTGDSGNGMTNSTIAGILICDLIMGNKNSWEKLYDPSRISLRATGDYIKEAGNMAAQYTDFLKAGDIKSESDLKPGEGGIISHGLSKLAVYKDEKGAVHTFSAICPHLGCIVQWNADERSFDCPCHGSRFSCEGKVMNGPAISDLPIKE